MSLRLIGWNVVIPFHKNLCQQCHMIPCAEVISSWPRCHNIFFVPWNQIGKLVNLYIIDIDFNLNSSILFRNGWKMYHQVEWVSFIQVLCKQLSISDIFVQFKRQGWYLWNRKERKTFQPLGANLHWYQSGAEFPQKLHFLTLPESWRTQTIWWIYNQLNSTVNRYCMMLKKISWTARKGWNFVWNLHEYFRPQGRI